MYNWTKIPTLLACLFLLPGIAEGESYGFGTAISEEDLKPWDIDISPDGKGLPPGKGTAVDGEADYAALCAACHGDFGEGMGRFPVLTGSPADLKAQQIRKTVGSYWPYATTLWDYIYRAMPFGNAQSLSADQVYGITAYVLAMNNIIAEDEVMNEQTLPLVKMPNREGFFKPEGQEFEHPACMNNCGDAPQIKSRASKSPLSQNSQE